MQYCSCSITFIFWMAIFFVHILICHYQESEAIIAAAGEVDAKNESERARQREKVKQAKEKKKIKREQQADLAAQMVELATEVAAA